MLNQKRVLIPASMEAAGTCLLDARPDLAVTRYDPLVGRAGFQAMLPDAAAVVLSATPFRAEEAAAAPLLQVVARLGVGFDAVEVPALTARGVPLMTAGTSNSRSVAEHAVFFLFALAKKSAEMHRRMVTGVGHDRLAALPGELAGKTVLVVGFGRIGSRTAPRCRALEMEVLVHDPYLDAEAIRAAGFEPVGLDDGLARADYVSLHCPKTPETIGLFGAERLARMKPGAALVNTARGGIVDEAALHAAIASGHLSGAGLDVFDREPPDPANPLLHLETVIASPHIAGVTVEAWAAICRTAAENVILALDGRPDMAFAVNARELATPA